MEKEELYRIVKALIEENGLPLFALALMKVVDDKTHEAAEVLMDVASAKKWSACSNAAVDFEKVAIKEFGG